MKIVILSDTHEKEAQVNVPEGDMLIHCGDLTNMGTASALIKVADWFKEQPHKYKIMISGNHDWFFTKPNAKEAIKMFQEAGVIYLQDSETVIEGLKIYGSPWQPTFFNWAFNANRGKDIAKWWSLIPHDTSILITHGPPHNILDLVQNTSSNKDRDLHQGCEELAKRVKELKELKLHCFGHLHTCGGQTQNIDGVIFANAAICTEQYQPTNKPIVIEL